MGTFGFPGGKGPDKATKFVRPVLFIPPVDQKLSGAAGSYSYTGQAATFIVGRKTAGANGSYAYTGQGATFVVGRKLAGTNGSYALTGQSATFILGRKLPGAAGAYSYVGQAAALMRTARSTVDPGGYFKNPNKGFNLEDWKKKNRKELGADLEEIYRELTASPVAEQAAQIVRPFAKSEQEIIPVQAVDWASLIHELKAIQALYDLRRILDDEDDIEFLLLNA